VVPDDFVVYFATAATAAGALIGLLFVAAALRPETVLGKDAPAAPGDSQLCLHGAVQPVGNPAQATGDASP
jgi:hypothetical protein